MDRDNDILQLREKWKSAGLSPAADTQQWPPRCKSCKAMQYRSRLVRRGLLMIIMCAVSPLWIKLLREGSVSPVLSIGLVAFFIIMTVLQGVELYKLNRIDIGFISLTEALERVLSLERFHNYARTAGMIMGFPLVALLIMHFRSVNEAAFWGSVSGAVLGLCIGIAIELRSRRWLRCMKESISAELTDN